MYKISQASWIMPIILALKRLSHEDYPDFKAPLYYIKNFRPVSAILWVSVSKTHEQK